MKKEWDYYKFKTIAEEERTQRIKIIAVIMIFVIIAILIIIALSGKNDVQTSKSMFEPNLARAQSEEEKTTLINKQKEDINLKSNNNQKGQTNKREDVKKVVDSQNNEVEKNNANLNEKKKENNNEKQTGEEQKNNDKKDDDRNQKDNNEKQVENKNQKLPQLTEVGKENMKSIYHSEVKRAFLTFDDGPSNITPQILDTLKDEKVKATFFMLGSNVSNYPETVRRVYKEGHYIANHGYTHTYSEIYSSPQTVLNEFNRCNESIQKVLNEPNYNSHLFRFPGGLAGGNYASIKQEAKELLEENDILNVDWNALTGDAETQHPVAEKLMENLKSTTEDKSSVVILMHDAEAKKVTADILSDVVQYLKEQGYEFKTFYDIIK